MSIAVDRPREARHQDFVALFTHALQGGACTVTGLLPLPHALPVARWNDTADQADAAVLAHCAGPTLDVGCGPGRMSAHLASRGVDVLGIDLVPAAVALTRARGACALVRDVFHDLPAEGAWSTVLLADGNIGIGGNPVTLLGRAHDLTGDDGRAVVDLSPPGSGLETRTVRLDGDGQASVVFRWAVVGVEAVHHVAAAAGWLVTTVRAHEGRWFAVLTKRGRR